MGDRGACEKTSRWKREQDLGDWRPQVHKRVVSRRRSSSTRGGDEWTKKVYERVETWLTAGKGFGKTLRD